ncbi:thioesterase II family protein [Actinophytocola gossypii]|uniref:Thioesterase n=1 Tax=Actinophytocola gossypii TaxID=2812003 RepID=A0ABT2JC26_9PSEU|nr:alpha/beta fold hydrolase [Actinophytocola gossypii]MCT2585124.1 thioesterase [Actinophytocola gossypii]
MTSPVSPWVRRFVPAPDAPARLVCFPHAGGSATYYLPVARGLAPSVDVLAIQYPGRQDRRHEPNIDDIERLADLVVAELAPWCDRPVGLFGHSMGALVAYEVARRLDTAPSVLFASGRRAPSRHRDTDVHRLDDDRLRAELARLSGTGAGLLDDEDMLAMILPATRADYRAVESYRYRPGPPLTCPVLAMVGDADTEATVDEVADWRAHTSGEFELRVFDGGHFYLTDHAGTVLGMVADRLPAAVR